MQPLTEKATFTVTFPDYYDDLAAFEIEAKGYLDDVLVRFDDGRSYLLSFRDSWNVQLDHDETGRTRAGDRYLAIPNVVVVETVTRERVLDAINALVGSEFFGKLGPAQISVDQKLGGDGNV
jgi:hypothetical protein